MHNSFIGFQALVHTSMMCCLTHFFLSSCQTPITIYSLATYSNQQFFQSLINKYANQKFPSQVISIFHTLVPNTKFSRWRMDFMKVILKKWRGTLLFRLKMLFVPNLLITYNVIQASVSSHDKWLVLKWEINDLHSKSNRVPKTHHIVATYLYEYN